MGVSEAVGRVSEAVGRPSEAAGRASAVAGKASEAAGKASEAAGESSWIGGWQNKKESLSPYVAVPKAIDPYGAAAPKRKMEGYTQWKREYGEVKANEVNRPYHKRLY